MYISSERYLFGIQKLRVQRCCKITWGWAVSEVWWWDVGSGRPGSCWDRWQEYFLVSMDPPWKCWKHGCTLIYRVLVAMSEAIGFGHEKYLSMESTLVSENAFTLWLLIFPCALSRRSRIIESCSVYGIYIRHGLINESHSGFTGWA